MVSAVTKRPSGSHVMVLVMPKRSSLSDVTLPSGPTRQSRPSSLAIAIGASSGPILLAIVPTHNEPSGATTPSLSLVPGRSASRWSRRRNQRERST